VLGFAAAVAGKRLATPTSRAGSTVPTRHRAARTPYANGERRSEMMIEPGRRRKSVTLVFVLAMAAASSARAKKVDVVGLTIADVQAGLA